MTATRASSGGMDMRAGTVATTIANVHRDPRKRSKPCTWLGFFPDPRAKEKMDDSEMFAVVKALHSAFGGTTEATEARSAA